MSISDSHFPRYAPHEGTLRIGGATLPRKAAACAMHFLERGVPIIDFFCIGGAANYQATKAMTVFRYRVEQANQGAVTLAFRPLRFSTHTEGRGSEIARDKDCIVWRTIVVESPDTANGPHNDEFVDS